VAILHVVIPVFNERRTLESCLDRITAVELPSGWSLRLRLIDDHSEAEAYDDAERLTAGLANAGVRVDLHRHTENQGKGAALRTGFDAILADPHTLDDDVVIIQDADLEYDPNDFPRLLEPLIDGRCDAVLGTRWGEHHVVHGVKRRVHAFGNRVLTVASNLMTGYAVRDMECCYKALPVRILRTLRPMLTESRFGIEPQIVASLARINARVEEVPVQYDPRGMDAGKKIGWRDAVRAIIVITRERFRGRPDA